MVVYASEHDMPIFARRMPQKYSYGITFQPRSRSSQQNGHVGMKNGAPFYCEYVWGRLYEFHPAEHFQTYSALLVESHQ